MTTLFYSEEAKNALDVFSGQKDKVVTKDLSKIVDNICKTGVSCYPWATLKTLLAYLLTQSVQKYQLRIAEDRKRKEESATSMGEVNNSKMAEEENDVVETRRQKIVEQLLSYDEAPFTLQRLCELIVNPHDTYTLLKKYLSALEKMVNITSTINTLSPQEISQINSAGYVLPSPDQLGSSSSTFSLGQEISHLGGVGESMMNVEMGGIHALFPHVTMLPHETHADNDKATPMEMY